MRFDVVTLFPEMVQDAASHGVTGRAVKGDIVRVNCWNPRHKATDTHRRVDDRPYGGGPGMVMLAEPLARTLSAIRQQVSASTTVYLSPQGTQIRQSLLQDIAADPQQNLTLLCGRYEGIDERFIETYVDEEWSLGDFVLSGGEIAAIAIIDAITRLIPGVLGDECSARQDSFMDGLLDTPHYTRPDIWQGLSTPAVLLNGNHSEINRWRLKQALGRTWQRRPDLLEHKRLNQAEKKLLHEFIDELDRQA